MSSTTLPKEQQSAYQRWELASFGDERPSAQQPSAETTKRTAELLAKQREEARQQGYAEGLEQGRAAGQEQARVEGKKEAARLKALVDALNEELTRATDTVADDMLNLSLDLAKAMLKTALKVRPELVLPVVSEAIRYLPSVQQPALLVLNPQDAALVRNSMSDELTKAGWRVTEDVQMARGGCRVETASNQIDATLEVRWQRIAEALGKQQDWLE
jgi:flagellar assembly protein FliH